MKSNTVLIVIVTLFLAAGAYWYFFTGGEQPPLSSDASLNEAQTQFQTLISELQPISFDTRMFSDARFNALVDITTPIASETSGRQDPFATVPGVSGN